MKVIFCYDEHLNEGMKELEVEWQFPFLPQKGDSVRIGDFTEEPVRFLGYYVDFVSYIKDEEGQVQILIYFNNEFDFR